MIEIDGSFGEGGGQILRSSLALSVVTGQPFTISNIRKNRGKPGLMRQHLTCVRAAARISQARLSGAELRSSQVVFRPKKLRAGDYTFRIGTAGSTTLVLQTVLPALITADSLSRISLEGGTHNRWAPPVDFIQLAYAPLIERLGPKVHVCLIKYGFYPAGGGAIEAEIQPAKNWNKFQLLYRGPVVARRARIINAKLPQHVAQRESEEILELLEWEPSEIETVSAADSLSPGNIVFLEVQSESLTEVFTGIGEKGVPAELVARQAITEAQRYLATEAAVGEHLADQIMLPLGISAFLGHGGGSFRTVGLSPHSQTHLEILEQFLDVKTRVTEVGRDEVEVMIR